MATKRAPAKRRKKKQASRVPAIFLAGIIAGVGGLLLVRAADDSANTSDPAEIDVVGTNPPNAENTNEQAPNDDGGEGSDGGSPGPATDPSNLGKPVQIFSDTLGDLDIDQIIDDWTPVDPPQLPDATAEVKSAWVANSSITQDLPDGFYWGVPINVFDENERGIIFDIRQAFFGAACVLEFGTADDSCNNDYGVAPQSGEQTYPSFLSDLLFVSMAITPDRNTAVTPATFWSLMNGGLPPLVTVPTESGEQESAFLVNSPFLLTIVDGTIIAAEGIWVP